MRELLTMFKTRSSSRHKVLDWMRDEWEKYANKKLFESGIWSEDANDAWTRGSGIDLGSDWERQITQYWDRARALGLDTPQGKQAMLKSALVLVDCCASLIRVYGDPPAPGYPSGEIHHQGEKVKQ